MISTDKLKQKYIVELIWPNLQVDDGCLDKGDGHLLSKLHLLYVYKLASVFCILSVSREGTNCAGEMEKTPEGVRKKKTASCLISKKKKIAY